MIVTVILGVMFGIGLIVLLYDRERFIHQTEKEVTLLKKEFLEGIDRIKQSYEKESKSNWNIGLLEACEADQEWFVANFKPDWTVEQLNNELYLASQDYEKAMFKQNEDLRPKAARIINLAYLFFLTAQENQRSKIQDNKKQSSKDLN